MKRIRFDSGKFTIYFMVILTVVGFSFTHPFMRYPFDVFNLIIRINDDWLEPSSKLPTVYHCWFFLWDTFFDLIGISDNRIFLRARIIHFLQSIVTFFSVFYFSRSVSFFVFSRIPRLHANLIAFWATCIWFSVFATQSQGHHLVWWQWYSVNYQISLPLVMLATGLTIQAVRSEDALQVFWYSYR